MSRVITKSYSSKCNNENMRPSHLKEYEKENIIDSQLEFIDPTPNLPSLFMQFNRRFFWGKLDMVEVKWSPRMTSCAGVCTYRGRRGGCVISLSAPLLSLRPRKDLVETLLHEMIHALLFVTHNNKDRDGHGPEFHKHMRRINTEAGTNISVYHSFHDEVAACQPHVWRCSGPCQKRKPFYGLLRRSMNRAPGPSDFWWAEHEATCGGKFIKIAEPEPRKKGKTSSASKDASLKTEVNNIKNYFTPTKTSTPISSPSDNKVVTLKDLPKASSAVQRPGPSTVFTLDDLPSQGTSQPRPTKSATKRPVSASKGQDGVAKLPKVDPNIHAKVRDVWASKSFEKPRVECPVCEKKFPEADINAHVDQCLSLDEEDDVVVIEEKVKCPVCEMKMPAGEVKEHLESCLSCSFENEDPEDDLEEEPRTEQEDMAGCPCCLEVVPQQRINQHIDECLTKLALQGGLLDDL